MCVFLPKWKYTQNFSCRKPNNSDIMFSLQIAVVFLGNVGKYEYPELIKVVIRFIFKYLLENNNYLFNYKPKVFNSLRAEMDYQPL